MDRARSSRTVREDVVHWLAGAEGQGLVEYGLILASVTLAVIVGGGLAGIGLDASLRLTASAL